MNAPHIDFALLVGYHALAVTPATAAAIEAHLLTCTECRHAFADIASGAGTTAVDRSDHPDRMWSAVLDRVDRPRRSLMERALRSLGVSANAARVLAVTPALRMAWLTAVALVTGLAIMVGRLGSGDPGPILVLAPLLPLAGVATAFGPRFDPTYEIGLATPYSGLRLTLLRTVAVLATSIPLLLVATLVAPGGGSTSFLWLLPCLALVSGTLALSSWIPVERAGIAVGLTWWVAVIALVHRGRAGGFVTRSIIFGPSGQLAMALIAGLCVTTLAVRRQHFDIGQFAGG